MQPICIFSFSRLTSISENTMTSLTLSGVKPPDSPLTHSHALACGRVLVRKLSKSPNQCPCTLSVPVCFTEIQGQRISLSFNSFFVSNRNIAVAHAVPNLDLFLISFLLLFTPLTAEIASNKLCSFHFSPLFSLLPLSLPFRPSASVGLFLTD